MASRWTLRGAARALLVVIQGVAWWFVALGGAIGISARLDDFCASPTCRAVTDPLQGLDPLHIEVVSLCAIAAGVVLIAVAKLVRGVMDGDEA